MSESHDKAAREAWRLMNGLVLDNDRQREVSELVGLSFGKLRALRRIANQAMTMRDLATLLGIDPPNLTPLVNDLERAGLVERRPHPTDGRAKLVTSTKAGTALAHKADQFMSEPPGRLSSLTAHELETLERILSRISSSSRSSGR